MILWTIRHTKPHNPQNVCYGRLDFDVSPSFQDEFPPVLEALKQQKANPELFYTSPLLRCKRLAEKVSEVVGFSPTECANIAEVHFGDWENQLLTEIDRSQMNAWKNDLRGYRFPNGESFYDVDKRVSKHLEYCLEQNKECLWVTHAGVIASVLHTYAGVPDDDFVEGKFAYATMTRFDFQKKNGMWQASFKHVYEGIPMPPLQM